MAITNGYATLIEVKQAMDIAATYTAATLSFTVATNVLADTAKGLKRFATGDYIQISGSVSNDGYYTVLTGNLAATLTTTEALANEAAGASVTITVMNDQKDDAIIERAIEAASRYIDDITGTRFYRSGADETRYYTGELPDVFRCPDDIGSITTLKTDPGGDGTFEESWTVTTDYHLIPYNATVNGEPFTGIEKSTNGGDIFPNIKRGIQLVGKFGYSASAPADVHDACIMLAQRYLKRKDAPLGVMGNATVGFINLQDALDPDVKALLGRWLTRRAYG